PARDRCAARGGREGCRGSRILLFSCCGLYHGTRDSRSPWCNCVIMQCNFRCQQSFAVSCLDYKKGISDQFRRQNTPPVENRELASRVSRVLPRVSSSLFYALAIPL